MGIYEWRPGDWLAAAQHASQLVARRRNSGSIFLPERWVRAWSRLPASRALLRAGAREPRTTSSIVVLAFALISWPLAGFAETSDVPGQFAVLGKGSAPCFTVVKAVEKTAQFGEADRQAMLSWAQGYLSFYNSVSEGTYDATFGTGDAALQEWLSDFCRKNPRASLINAVDELLAGSAKQPLLNR